MSNSTYLFFLIKGIYNFIQNIIFKRFIVINS